jgi:hypothetical protein
MGVTFTWIFFPFIIDHRHFKNNLIPNVLEKNILIFGGGKKPWSVPYGPTDSKFANPFRLNRELTPFFVYFLV